MAARSSSPTVRRLELGRRLRELREGGGFTPEDIARELECSTTKISRIESGQRVATALDLKVLSRFYGLSADQHATLVQLGDEARSRGWWHDYRTLDEQTRMYADLESAASRVFQIESTRVPGLLQTEEYIGALIPRLRPPHYQQSESWVEDIISLRLRRQKRVLSGELDYAVIVDEAALHRKLGPPGLMDRQVQHLMEVGGLANVRLQLITFDVGSHVGLDEPFTLLSFTDEGFPDVVYVEGLGGNHLLQSDGKTDRVQDFRESASHLLDEVALPPNETLDWLDRFLAARSTSPTQPSRV